MARCCDIHFINSIVVLNELAGVAPTEMRERVALGTPLLVCGMQPLPLAVTAAASGSAPLLACSNNYSTTIMISESSILSSPGSAMLCEVDTSPVDITPGLVPVSQIPGLLVHAGGAGAATSVPPSTVIDVDAPLIHESPLAAFRHALGEVQGARTASGVQVVRFRDHACTVAVCDACTRKTSNPFTIERSSAKPKAFLASIAQHCAGKQHAGYLLAFRSSANCLSFPVASPASATTALMTARINECPGLPPGKTIPVRITIDDVSVDGGERSVTVNADSGMLLLCRHQSKTWGPDLFGNCLRHRYVPVSACMLLTRT